MVTGLLGLFDGTIGLKLSIHFNANMGISKERMDKMENVRTSILMIIVGLLFGSLGFMIAAYS